MKASLGFVHRTHPKIHHDLSEEQVTQIRMSLLSWFQGNARILPWRLPPVAFDSASYGEYSDRLYRCLISETMLQQTQVKTVLAYYEKWLEKFPSLELLAQAAEEDVMACWAGLGYYSRAKRLQQAAQYLVENFVSQELEFPRDPEHWIKKVPGVGPYTAGAIISISFGIPSAIIDGNVQRVLSRILAVHGDTSTPKAPGTKLLWQRAGQLVQGDEPGNLNQSLMELGATICSPTQPSCKQCPISANCLAYQQSRSFQCVKSDFFAGKTSSSKKIVSEESPLIDLEDICSICPSSVDITVMPDKPDTYIQTFYPYKVPKKAQREEISIVIVVRRGSEVYVEKKAKGLLAGLFDFPTILLDEAAQDDIETLLERHKQKLGAKILGTTLHLFTHIRRTSHVLVCDYQRAEKAIKSFQEANETGRWIEEVKLGDLGVSELCLKNSRTASGLERPKKRKEGSPKTPRPLKRLSTTSVHRVAEEIDQKQGKIVTAGFVADTSDDLTSLKVLESTSSVNNSSPMKTTPKSKLFALFERKRGR